MASQEEIPIVVDEGAPLLTWLVAHATHEELLGRDPCPVLCSRQQSDGRTANRRDWPSIELVQILMRYLRASVS